MARFFGRKKNIHPQSNGYGWLTALRSEFNYAATIGDGSKSSAVAAPVRWIQRNFTEAPIRLRRYTQNELELVSDHSFMRFMKRPNPYYSMNTMLKATAGSWVLDGNGYWLLTLNDAGAPVESYWVPHGMVEPHREQGSQNFVDFYKYDPGDGRPRNIAPVGQDRRGYEVEPGYAMVTFRDGIDPSNPMKGVSGLKTLMREVFTDEEASNYTASLLRNMGVPGIIISPSDDGGGLAPIGDEDVQVTKQKFKDLTTGDSRGEPLVMTGPVKIDKLGFNPAELDLKAIRRVVEERVTAVIGIPAIVCGLGAGLDRSTFSNMNEAKDSAYEDMILPMQRDFADTLQTQLLPEFEANADAYYIDFDNSEVRALSDDKDKQTARIVSLTNAGIMTVAEGRDELGLDVEDYHRVFHLPLNIIEYPEGSSSNDVETGADASENDSAASKSFTAMKMSREAQKRLHALLIKNSEKHTNRFAKELEAMFADLAKQVANAWRAKNPQLSHPTKATDAERAHAAELDASEYMSPAMIHLVNEALDDLNISAWQADVYGKKLKAHYIAVADDTTMLLADQLGLEIGSQNIISSEIAKAGGKRQGLVYMTEQTRAATYQAVADGLSDGAGVDAIERRIREYVESGGRGRSVSARALRIARTETAHAQRLASLETYKVSGAYSTVEAIDDQMGHGDDACMARNNAGPVPFAVAEEWNESEHPNGTLDFVPGEII